jgi:hypothetical protein
VTRGSKIHDEVSDHFRRCAQCSGANPEEIRIRQAPALRLTVPDAVIATLCPVGRPIYRAYLRWLAEPDE